MSAYRLRLECLNEMCRYHQLVLHDPVWYDHLPYIPFPSHWPVFTPKDKLAEWFESYAKLLELNVWTETKLESASWDAGKRQWTVNLERKKADGNVEKRTLHPRHVIQATGHSGEMSLPQIKGMEGFKGDRLCHSSQFRGAKPHSEGKKAIVVGCCNSGHDIAQDFYENGYDVGYANLLNRLVWKELILRLFRLRLYSGHLPM